MKDKGKDAFLVFNLKNKMLDEWVELTVGATDYVFMNAMTGAITKAETKGDKLHLQLQLEESVLIKCLGNKSGARPHRYSNTTRMKTDVNVRWHLSFIDGGPVYPGDIDLACLQSWAEAGDAETSRFSGTVRYSTDLEWEGENSAWIDLGEVYDCARILVNDKDYGTFLGPAYVLEINNLKRGNHIIIDVTNVAANRIRDLDKRGVNWKKFKNINYHPFDASEWPVREAGLLGRVVMYE